jgi:hypothetical protein
MKTLTYNTAIKQIKDGKIECITDIKIGFVEIRRSTGKREMINVIDKPYKGYILTHKTH